MNSVPRPALPVDHGDAAPISDIKASVPVELGNVKVVVTPFVIF